MRDPLFALRIAAGSALLAAVGTAQKSEQLHAVTTQVKDAGTYHIATQTWTRAPQQTGLGPDVLYNNSVLSGYFIAVREAQVRVDEGRIPSTTSEGNSDVYTINGFQFGYCTSQTNPLTAAVFVFNSYAPCSNPAAATLTSGIGISGIPTTASAGTQGCWLVTIDLQGSTLEYNLDGDADGFFDNSAGLDSFGIGLNMTGHANDGTTGWLICGDPGAAPFGAGTKSTWGFGAGPDGTGLGQQDSYWIDDVGGLAPGCYWFGGYPANPWGGYREILFGDKAAGGPNPYCAPGGANSVSAGGGVLSYVSGYGTAAATFDITSVPNQPGILYTGANQIQIPFGCGDRCAGGQNVRGAVLVPSGNQALGVVFDMSTSGNTNIQFWYRDPANFANCGSAFNLTNALGL